MPIGTHSTLSRLTDVFSSDDIEAAARRPGFVKRASKLTGTLCLALGTFGAWRDATTPLAQWAAQVTHWDEQVAGAPDALHQRMNQRALAVLPAMSRPVLAKGHSREKVCDDGLFPYCTKVSLADSTGCELPDSLHERLPGAGGRAAKAGANIQAVGADTSRVFDHCVLTPWNLPEQKYGDHVSA